MAEAVARLPGSGGRKKMEDYPWDEWLDGQVWLLKRDKDFAPTPQSMRAYVYRAARSRGIGVETVRGIGGALYVRAILEPRESAA